ncbi:alpha/beta fold hydrolase [Croceicoccus sp. F390]|uniref:Alpha/beta fold hydrolase n=1 Tax=Croceicoccus esteveae TaxID=3075597 RepID=A0ABU2ZDW2_9SPHN|nr:alpha/beta fold hydrolase [Croceicoccus sp. F390]MDT0574795.1 alpha/beta fold hydrolase [Croceicoccus sp. F390]
MTQDTTQTFAARDGTRLVVHLMGEGAPVILLHGVFSNAYTNWIKFGHAAKLAKAGFQVLMPDLRAHGDSEAPHDPSCYHADVLMTDLEDMIGQFGLTESNGEYDLAGFSLGARTALRAVVGGIAPRRLAIIGMGLEGLSDWNRRAEFFFDAIDRFDNVRMGDRAFMAVSFMKTMKIDRVAARLLLGTMTDIAPAALEAVTMPTLVMCGDKDDDNGSPDALVRALPDARRATIPGTHMSSVAEGALGDALVRFLAT